MIRHRILASTIAAILVVSSMGTQAFAVDTKTAFNDTKGHWAEEAIQTWSNYGLVSGDNSGNFNPNASITRKDLCVILNNLIGLSATGHSIYSDLEQGKYYTESMLALADKGIIKGSNNSIRPQGLVTREEAAVIIGRAFSLEVSESETNFSDKNDISYWARAYVASIAHNKIMQGDTSNRFNPKKLITRAEVIKVLDNVVNTYVTQNILENKVDGDVVTNGDTMTYRGLITKSTIYSLGNSKLDIKDSMITGKVVTGATEISISNSNIEKLVITSDKADIILNGTVKELVLQENNVNIDGETKGSIKLKAGNTLVYNGLSITNSTKQDMVYNQESLDSVKFESKSLKVISELSSSNELIVSISAPYGTVEKYGLLINNGTQVPVYADSDEKSEMEQAVTKGTSKEEVLNRTLKPNEVLCYRAFSISANGTKIEYSKPVIMKAYDYNIGVYLANTSMNQTSGKLTSIYKNIQVVIDGSNIPEIKSVEIASSKSEKDLENMVYTKAELISTVKNEINTEKIYKAIIEFNVTQYGEVSIDKYYGYRITLVDGKVIELFPVLTDNSLPVNTVKSIKTGTAKFDGTLINVANNSYEGDKVIETGILILCKDYNTVEPDFISVTDGWVEHKSKSITDTNVQVDCGNTANKKIYYAFYVKTDTSVSYGSIRTLMGQSIPVYTGNLSVDMNTAGNIASLKIQVETVTDIDIQKSKIEKLTETGSKSELGTYTNKSLVDFGAKFSGDILKITMTGLAPNTEYTMALKIKNETGISDSIVIQFRTTV